MSSSPIEHGPDAAPLFAEPAATGAELRAAGADSHRRWFKRMLPRSLYGRSLLILVLPLVLAQIIATWIFYDRHWDTVARRLSASVAADTEIYYGFRPGETLPKGMRRSTTGRIDEYLADAISQRLGLPFQIDGDFD